MAHLVFTQQLARFIPVPTVETAASRLRDALDASFGGNPLLRGYVLNDQGHLRENVVIFVDGCRVADRTRLDVPLRTDSVVYILQALSGG